MSHPLAELYAQGDYVLASVRKGKRLVEGWHNREDYFDLHWEGFKPEEQDRLETMILMDTGLTGTGWTSELRDMIAQLSMIAAQLGVEVEIPPATQLAIDCEDLENPLSLPDGAMW
jgi:hypothetical protein